MRITSCCCSRRTGWRCYLRTISGRSCSGRTTIRYCSRMMSCHCCSKVNDKPMLLQEDGVPPLLGDDVELTLLVGEDD